MDEWNLLDEAIRERRWEDAAGTVRAFLAAWNEAKPLVLWFALEEAEVYIESVGAELSSLASLLENDPVDEVAVHRAKAKVQRLLPPQESVW